MTSHFCSFFPNNFVGNRQDKDKNSHSQQTEECQTILVTLGLEGFYYCILGFILGMKPLRFILKRTDLVIQITVLAYEAIILFLVIFKLTPHFIELAKTSIIQNQW